VPNTMLSKYDVTGIMRTGRLALELEPLTHANKLPLSLRTRCWKGASDLLPSAHDVENVRSASVIVVRYMALWVSIAVSLSSWNEPFENAYLTTKAPFKARSYAVLVAWKLANEER
jgi:hypothetical protein